MERFSHKDLTIKRAKSTDVGSASYPKAKFYSQTTIAAIMNQQLWLNNS